MMLELEADVSDDRELTLTLPPEVPAGRVRVRVTWESEPLPGGYVRRKLHPSLVPEKDAYIRMLPELLKTHLGKYVVIQGGRLIAFGAKQHEVLKSTFEIAPGPMHFLSRVWDGPVPMERLPSIREIRRGDSP